MKSKHFDTSYHFVQELYQSRRITVDYIALNENLADVFIKPGRKLALNIFQDHLFRSRLKSKNGHNNGQNNSLFKRISVQKLTKVSIKIKK